MPKFQLNIYNTTKPIPQELADRVELEARYIITEGHIKYHAKVTEMKEAYFKKKKGKGAYVSMTLEEYKSSRSDEKDELDSEFMAQIGDWVPTHRVLRNLPVFAFASCLHVILFYNLLPSHLVPRSYCETPAALGHRRRRRPYSKGERSSSSVRAEEVQRE